MKTAVIILGQGSKNTGAGDAFQKIIAEVNKLGEYELVEHAFLQYTAPTINDVRKSASNNEQRGS